MPTGAPGCASASSAIPKSDSTTRPSPVISTFAGFTSRWSTPAACAASSADSTARPIRAARSGGSGPFSRMIRSSEWPVREIAVPALTATGDSRGGEAHDALVAAVVEAVTADRGIDSEGTLAVIAPQHLVADLVSGLDPLFPGQVAPGTASLTRPISVLSPATYKGLEFDSVRDRPLGEIWLSGSAFQKYRGTDWMKEPCRSCPRREIDYGGCLCQAFALTGDAANTDPACSLSPMHEEWAQVAEVESHQASPEFIYRRPGGATPKVAKEKTPVPTDA